jgi:hypothetical protein
MKTEATYLWSGYCAGLVDEQIFTIFNRSPVGQGAETEIKRLEVVPVTPASGNNSGQSIVGSPYQFIRTTAQAGGVAVPSVKLDTATASLPSEVELAQFSTYTLGSVVRQKLQCLPSEVSVGNPSLGAGGGARTDKAECFSIGSGFATTQELTLREGEGFAIVTDLHPFPSHPSPNAFHCTLTFQLSSGGTFVANTYLQSTPAGIAALALFNGSGSGVVLRILSVTTTYVGAVNTFMVPYFDDTRVRFSRVDGASGESSSGVALDSSAHVPTDILCYRQLPWLPVTSGLAQLAGSRLGVPSPNLLGYPHANVMTVRGSYGTLRSQQTHRFSQMTSGGGTGITDCDQYRSDTKLGVGWSRGNASPARGIKLRAGQGFAFIGSANSSFPWWWVECTYVIRRMLRPATQAIRVVS